jgi:hypothetical protein
MSATDPSVTPGAVAPSAPQVTYPEDYEELKGYRDRYNSLAETLSPYVDDIRPIIEDEDRRNFWREANKTYEDRLKAREPEIAPEFQPLVKHFEEKFAPVVEYATNQQKREAEAAAKAEAETKGAAEAAQRANLEYAKKLAAERPDLADDEFAGIGMLAAYAANRGISLEEAWNRKGSSMGAPVKREKPPTSLRGDAAAPGVPGESTEPKITSMKGLTKRLASNLRAAGMKG